jgi:carbamoyl-phosphate synthase large subunit
MASLATRLMMGKKIKDLNIQKRLIPYIGVKEAVFPFNMFPEVDPVLGPEMTSTGEVLGIAESFDLAYWKAQEAVNSLPTKGTVLITVAERDRSSLIEVAKQFIKLGFKIRATTGTQIFLASHGVVSEHILKEHEGQPNITDAIENKEIQLVINTPSGKLSKYDDSYIRKTAIKYKVPYITSLTAALAAVRGIAAYSAGKTKVKSIQEYHAELASHQYS